MLGEIVKSLIVYCVVPLFSSITPHTLHSGTVESMSLKHQHLYKHAHCGWSHILNESANIKRLAGPYTKAVIKYSKESRVNPLIVAAVMHVENNGFIHNGAASRRVSYSGAIGPMQIMPSTGEFMGVNPWVPKDNIKGGVKYIAYLLKSFNYNVTDALIAYNEGPSALKHGVVYPNAVNYADRVIRISKS